MHLLVQDSRSLDEEEAAVDLGHRPAELVFLSFSDSDLGAAATTWQAMGPERPTLRLANLARLRHPMSVDLYAERVIAHARVFVESSIEADASPPWPSASGIRTRAAVSMYDFSNRRARSQGMACSNYFDA